MSEIQLPLLNFFHRVSIFYWENLIAEWNGPIPQWKEVDLMQMPADIASLWDKLKMRLRNCGIFRLKDHDSLTWRNSKVLYQVQVKDVYKDLIRKAPSLLNPPFPSILWKTGCPLKMILFSWLAFHNRNLTWDTLRKRGWQGLGVCHICWAEEESNFHLFFACKKTRLLWRNLEHAYGVQLPSLSSMINAFLWCCLQKKTWRSIFIITVWCIWKWRNKVIFNGKTPHLMDIFSSISSIFESIPQSSPKMPLQKECGIQQAQSVIPRAFFDGAEQEGQCGCRVHIVVNELCSFQLFWNGGSGSNSKAEAMALAGLLHFCLFLNLQGVSIFDDSKVLVDSLNGKVFIRNPQLLGWIERINFFWNRSEGASICHIKRDLNHVADGLSKKGLRMALGLWFLQVSFEGNVISIQDFLPPDF